MGQGWGRGGAPGDDVICVRVGCAALPACVPTQHTQLVATQPQLRELRGDCERVCLVEPLYKRHSD